MNLLIHKGPQRRRVCMQRKSVQVTSGIFYGILRGKRDLHNNYFYSELFSQKAAIMRLAF